MCSAVEAVGVMRDVCEREREQTTMQNKSVVLSKALEAYNGTLTRRCKPTLLYYNPSLATLFSRHHSAPSSINHTHSLTSPKPIAQMAATRPTSAIMKKQVSSMDSIQRPALPPRKMTCPAGPAVPNSRARGGSTLTNSPSTQQQAPPVSNKKPSPPVPAPPTIAAAGGRGRGAPTVSALTIRAPRGAPRPVGRGIGRGRLLPPQPPPPSPSSIDGTYRLVVRRV
jgi:hypothetical protein